MLQVERPQAAHHSASRHFIPRECSPSTPSCDFCPPVLQAAAWKEPAMLATAIQGSPTGVLILANAAAAPFDSIRELFDSVTLELGARANAAYNGGGARLVYKNAHGEGRGGPLVDEKVVLDLSAHRMQEMTSVDPGMSDALGEPLHDALSFFDGITTHTAPGVLAALKLATGCEQYGTDEARFAYRLVDYGLRAGGAGAPPRCGAHRDFGTATLIWQDGPGLEVRVGDSWLALPPLPPTSAVLLFGLCTVWRSNDRIRAAEHRVVDVMAGPDGSSPRRLSAVLFMGLCDNVVLAPCLTSPGEAPVYKEARVGAVHPVVRRKWSTREGSVTAEERAAEEAERLAYPTQESLIAALYKLV